MVMHWKTKVLIQFILAKLPKGEAVNHFLQVVNGTYSRDMIRGRLLAYSNDIQCVKDYQSLEGADVLEIGTGWDGLSALSFYLMGARTVYTYDHVPHVRYRVLRTVLGLMEEEVAKISETTGIPEAVLRERLARLEGADDVATVFRRANIFYKAPADAARSGMPDHSVDLIYSMTVLEHVPPRMVHALMVEAKRILRPHGVIFHMIGLGDHYARVGKGTSNVNFLRYPERTWRFWVLNRISYHNRIREKQFIEIFESHGATILWQKHTVDPKDIEVLKTLPVDKKFAGMTDEELAVKYSRLILSFQEAATPREPSTGAVA